MKSSESKTTTPAHLPPAQKAPQPFFRKDGEGAFFAKEAAQPGFFFNSQPIQTKLNPGQPGAAYKMAANTAQPAIQTKCAECEQEEQLQRKPDPERTDVNFAPVKTEHEQPASPYPVSDAGQGNFVQRFAACESRENCPERTPGEMERSRTAPMELFTMSGEASGVMLGRFSIESDEIRGDPTGNANWNGFVGSMASSPHITWEILGFSDCQGNEALNASLRIARATALYLALPDDAKAQVETYGGAPLTDCMRNNSTEENRSLNRSAIIRQKTTNYEFDPETIEGDNSRTVFLCSKPLDTSPMGSHAFFRLDNAAAGNETLSLQPIQVIPAGDCWQGVPAMNYASDRSATGECERTAIRWVDLFNEFNRYPIGHYCTLGPNSNTFVGHLARRCGMPNPDPAGWTPGIDDSPPPPGTYAPDKWATLTGCETKTCIPDAQGDTPETNMA